MAIKWAQAYWEQSLKKCESALWKMDGQMDKNYEHVSECAMLVC